MVNTLPLLPGASDAAPVAFRDGRLVGRAEFLAHVQACAARLPAATQAMNLCNDRYWFAVALLACASRGIVSLLPNSAAPEHLASLSAQAPGLLCIGDQETSPLPHLPYLHIGEEAEPFAGGVPSLAPRIAADQRVARVFTSGSTGQPQGHDKYFGCLQASVNAAARRVWAVAGGPCTVVGTPNFRHMYGLESTVLLPLLGGGCLSSRQPFFPADIAAALAELPEPRLLVTTPFHLRKLLEAEVKLPRLAALLSATAPLSAELARRAEAQLDAPLLEIYGATELGQVATRHTSQHDEWETLDGLSLAQAQDLTIASGPALHEPQPLNDVVELLSPTRFRLIDRGANLVNIVGKRSSLSFLNQLLLQLPGVKDGVFCLPEAAQAQDDARLAAFVVAPGLSAADIIGALRPHIDPVFLPRPLVLIDELPRDANGKVLARTLQALIAEHLSHRA